MQGYIVFATMREIVRAVPTEGSERTTVIHEEEAMLVTYLSAFVIGGFFVALSAFSGVDEDLGGDAGVDMDADAGVDLGGDGDASIAEASHGGRARGRRPFNPLLSFRFWTFSAAFFGLTGSLLEVTESTSEPFTMGLSLLMGIGTGLGVSWLVRALREPVSGGVKSVTEHTGAVGSLLLNLKQGGTSKVRLRLEQQDVDFLAVAADSQPIAKGERVVILGFTDAGMARVAPERTLFKQE